MRVLQIGKFYPPYYFGGIETFSENLHKALNQKGIDSDIVAFLPKGYKKDIYEDNHIILCKTDFEKHSTQFSKSFFNYLKNNRKKYDIIFVNVPHPFANLALWLFPPDKNSKIVLYWHSDIIKQKFLLFFYKPLLVWLINKSSLVVAPTEIHLEQSDFAKYFKNKKKILPFVLNYKTSGNSYKLTENGKKVIYACGRLTHYKGFDILIEAAQYISDDAEIHISGTGQLQKELTDKIQKLNLQSKVKLLGRLSNEELNKQYEDCYLFCFPSINRAEMMGLVQYEAFSHSKPVVSTEIPRSAAPTLNHDGFSGFKVEINDAKALAEKINIILKDEELYKKLSEGAGFLSKKYNDPEIVNMYIQCFEELLASNCN